MSQPGAKLLAFRHYSKIKPFKCSRISGDTDNFFTVQLQEVTHCDSFLKGDPIIYGYMNDKAEIEINGGYILSANLVNRSILISPDKPYSGTEKRQSERFPISLLGYIRLPDQTKQLEFGYIKDISYSGFRIYTSLDLNVSDIIELGMCSQNSIINFEVSIVRKSVCYGRFEYGVSILHRTKESIYVMKDYFDNLVKHEKELLLRQLLK